MRVRSSRGERRWPLTYPVLVSLGAGVLASCVGAEPQQPLHTSAGRPLPRPEVPPVQSAAPRPARKPIPPDGMNDLSPGEEASGAVGPKPSESGAGSATSALSSEVAAASPPVPASGHTPSHVELIGLDEPSATRLFGPATEKSDAPPATVWRYKTASCELDLFFYLDLRSGRMRTLHYAFKGDDTGARRQDCLRSLFVSGGG